MPVSDYQHMLRLTGVMTDTEDSAAGVLMGRGPLNGMKVRVYVPAITGTDTPTTNIKIQECDDNSTWVDVPGGAFPAITVAGYYEIHMHWTKLYLRYHATNTGTTPNFGVVTIGLTPGQIPTT
jgi:hypothetical protein